LGGAPVKDPGVWRMPERKFSIARRVAKHSTKDNRSFGFKIEKIFIGEFDKQFKSASFDAVGSPPVLRDRRWRATALWLFIDKLRLVCVAGCWMPDGRRVAYGKAVSWCLHTAIRNPKRADAREKARIT
jgi:hypothetical protein